MKCSKMYLSRNKSRIRSFRLLKPEQLESRRMMAGFGDVWVRQVTYNRSNGTLSGDIYVAEKLTEPVLIQAFWLNRSGERISEIARTTIKENATSHDPYWGGLEFLKGSIKNLSPEAVAILVVADDAEVYEETNEGNNHAIVNIQPELGFISGGVFTAGEGVYMRMKINGLLYEYSTDIRLDWTNNAGEVLGTAYTRTSLTNEHFFSGDTFEIRSGVISKPRPSGATKLIAKLDPGQRFLEADETDNEMIFDLQTDLTALASNENHSIKGLLKDEFYWVQVAWSNAKGEDLGLIGEARYRVGEHIPPGTLVDGTRPAGASHVRYRVDPNNEFTEINENNNETLVDIRPTLSLEGVNHDSASGVLWYEYEANKFLADEKADVTLYWTDRERMILKKISSHEISLGSTVGNPQPYLSYSFADRPSEATHLLLALDGENRYVEANEDDNQKFVDMRPTLVAESARFDPNAVTITYVASGLFGGIQSEIWIDWANDLGQSIGQFRRLATSKLGEGRQSETFSFDPKTIPAGATQLLIRIDPENQFPEINELDNEARVVLPKTDPDPVPTDPDLIGVWPNIAIEGLLGSPGRDLFADWLVGNHGTGKSASSFHGFYLSKDETFDTTDPLLVEMESSPISAGIDSYAFSDVIPLPTGLTEGDYFIFLFVDHKNKIAESDENNNLAVTRLTVTQKSPYQNPLDPYLVMRSDNAVTPLDALVIINELYNRTISDPTTSVLSLGKKPVHFFDVNGDFRVSALDALMVINYVLQVPSTSSQGELHATSIVSNDLNKSVLDTVWASWNEDTSNGLLF